MVENIRHVGFSVRDEEKALSFYCNLLGFKIVTKAKEDESLSYKLLKARNLNYIKLEKNGQLIELYVMPRDFEKGKWNHIALTVENIDEVYKTLSEEGVRFISPPTVDSDSKHK